jgi:CheY-like chemotaxis protein
MTSSWPAPVIQAFLLFHESQWKDGTVREPVDSAEQVDQNKRTKIMVIDDESLIAETVVEILTQVGFDATAVSDGSAAIEVAKTSKPDIVLSDVIMPGLNGVETGIRIREIVPDCRIILFSGQAATVDLLERARQQGHQFEILAKPMKPDQLISVIRGRQAD